MQLLVTQTLHDLLITVSDQPLGVTADVYNVWILPLQHETVACSKFFSHQ